MKRAALFVLLTIVAAGCIGVEPDETEPTGEANGPASMEDCQGLWDPPAPGGDFSLEYLNVTIRADGTFKVGVPAPVYDPETSVESWARNTSALGEAATIEPATTTRD